MKLSFYGAAGQVTGSCYLLETASAKILIDCGMFQGTRFSDEQNHTDFPFLASEIVAVLVTHAHLDHTGRIPKLVHDGFRGKIFATAPTAELAKIIWDDALEVMKYDEEKLGHPILFHADDIAQATAHFYAVQYRSAVEIAPGIVATWHDAGHILGSGFIEIHAEGKSLVFSGDLGTVDVPILRPLAPLPSTDILVIESTYGGHRHEDVRTRVSMLRDAIIQTINSRGVLLIPAFAIERIQEILYELDALVDAKSIPRVPIFLDSPMAIRATEIFKKHTEYYDADAMARLHAGHNLFEFPGLRATLTRDESRTINDVPPPKVIIAGAGMMTGGRVLHHARRYLLDRNTTLLIVGYQAVGTLGRAILNGADRVRIYGNTVPVLARVKKIGGYSAHADRDGLINWIAMAPQKPAKVFLVHGEPDSQMIMASDLMSRLKIKPFLPRSGAVYELDQP